MEITKIVVEEEEMKKKWFVSINVNFQGKEYKKNFYIKEKNEFEKAKI